MTIFEFSTKIQETAEKSENNCKESFARIEKIAEYNSQKVLKAFLKCKISESHFVPTTGYGYNDFGRDKLDELYANIFHTEDALVRHNFVSGTHTLTTALFGILRPGDKFLSITGLPYDTMISVIGDNKIDTGSLKNFGIDFDYIDWNEDEALYFEILRKKMIENFKVIYIQRSRGYTLRKSLSVKEIEKIISFVKNINPEAIIIVDNCYGEFVETTEPSDVGADLTVGSLIKNPGGGIAPSGGYIVGKRKYVEQCAYRLTSPGIGKEAGASLGHNREIFMGIYNAPKTVAEALKTAVFAAEVFSNLGFEVYPKSYELRNDIVQSVVLRSGDLLINFCRGIQSGSPIDSFVTPEPWSMPGYDSDVIMAAGTFISGSSLELSADGPMREPYPVWVQGGTNFYTAKIGVLKAAENIVNNRTNI